MLLTGGTLTKRNNMKKSKKLIHPWSCQTEDKFTKKGSEMEILSHSEVNEIISEIKNCVCQYDRVMDIDVKNFPDFHSQMQAAEEKKIKGNELKRRINKRLKSIFALVIQKSATKQQVE